jgi:GT2 family glycosyltransferase
MEPDESPATIVICTRDRPALLARSLQCAGRAAARVEGVQLLVVEQGRGTAAEICARDGIRAEVVRDDGVGLSRARNIAARFGEGEILLYTDDDCEVPESWVEGYLRAFPDESVAAAFGPTIGFGTPKHTGRVSPDSDLAWRPWHVGHGANMAVRRRALQQIGGFDERLGAGTKMSSGEDADLIVRLLVSGAGVVSNIGPPVKHQDWRSAAELRDVRLGYERGSGAWIGKALRCSGRRALPFLTTRVEHMYRYDALIRHDGRFDVRGAAAVFRTFTSGLIRGFAMRPNDRWLDVA